MAVSFGLFGTLVTVEYDPPPAEAIADELRDRGVDIPDDWADAYRETHIDAPEGAEVPHPAHVSAALASRDVAAPNNAARRAVVSAFDPEVETLPGAAEAIARADTRSSVGLLANCSVPELVPRVLIRAEISRDAFDAVVTSVGCGWRKPHPQAFARVADALGSSLENLVHVEESEMAEMVATDSSPAAAAQTPRIVSRAAFLSE